MKELIGTKSVMRQLENRRAITITIGSIKMDTSFDWIDRKMQILLSL